MNWEMTGLLQGLNEEEKIEMCRVFDEILMLIMTNEPENAELINITLPVARRLMNVQDKIDGKWLISDLKNYMKENPCPILMDDEPMYCEKYVKQLTKH